MIRDNTFDRFAKGYYRPVSMPQWKWNIVCIIWIFAILGYVLAMFTSLWISIFGLIFHCLGMYLPSMWDTGEWKNTKEGQKYIKDLGIKL